MFQVVLGGADRPGVRPSQARAPPPGSAPPAPWPAAGRLHHQVAHVPRCPGRRPTGLVTARLPPGRCAPAVPAVPRRPGRAVLVQQRRPGQRRTPAAIAPRLTTSRKRNRPPLTRSPKASTPHRIEMIGSDSVRPGCAATSRPAFSADCARTCPAMPVAIIAYSGQLVNSPPKPPAMVCVMPFLRAAVSPNAEPAATPRTAASPEPLPACPGATGPDRAAPRRPGPRPEPGWRRCR